MWASFLVVTCSIIGKMKEQLQKAKSFLSVNNYPLVLIVGGLLGLYAAYTLTVDKIHLLEDPGFVPSCNINPILSCLNVMSSDQSNAFGFPNPFLGLTGFAAVIVVGFTLLAGGKMASWYWRLFNLGALFGFIFNHYLIWQTLYNIGSLCLWCMLVWIVTWPILLYTTLYNVQHRHITLNGNMKKLYMFVDENHLAILFAWYIIIAMLILERFWYYWETLLPF